VRIRTLKFLAGTAIAAGIVLVGFTGISMGVSDDATVTGRSAQEPLGSQVHASPQTNQGVAGEQDEVPPPGGTVAGETETLNETQPAPLPDTGQVSGSGGDDAASLPFTGFVAISLLLLGTGLLGTGLALRRRRAPATTA
jgi:hypothetical protein